MREKVAGEARRMRAGGAIGSNSRAAEASCGGAIAHGRPLLSLGQGSISHERLLRRNRSTRPRAPFRKADPRSAARRHGERPFRHQAAFAACDTRQPSRRNQHRQARVRVDLLDPGPAVLLGVAPLALTAWTERRRTVSPRRPGTGRSWSFSSPFRVAWLGWRPLLRLAENNFWSLNALAVQPGYALWREALRHLIERSFKGRTGAELARMRAWSCAAGGLLLFPVAALVALARLARDPLGRLGRRPRDPHRPRRSRPSPTRSSSCPPIWRSRRSSGASPTPTADQPLDLEAFDEPRPGARVWRVAHLSDVHFVGERYGFRIESGRAGPRGNDVFERVKRVWRPPCGRAARPRPRHRRHDRRRHLRRMGRIPRHRRPAIPNSRSGC